MKPPGYLKVVRLVLAKDLRTELRSKETLATMLLFGLVLTFVFAFGFVFGCATGFALDVAFGLAPMSLLRGCFPRKRKPLI